MNASKTKTMLVVAWSRTIHAPSLELTIGGTVLKESDELVILGVTFYSKMTFESIFARFPEQLLKDLVS